MAFNFSSKLLQRSASSAKTIINRTCRLSPTSVVAGESKVCGFAPMFTSSAPRISRRHTAFTASRLVKVLSSGESLMPLHSVTASALLKSMLASEVGQWGSLSEGFATPL